MKDGRGSFPRTFEESIQLDEKRKEIVSSLDGKLKKIAEADNSEKRLEMKSLLLDVATYLDSVELELVKKRITESLGIPRRAINELINEYREYRIGGGEYEIPSNIVWEEPRKFCPALDFIDGIAYVTVTLYKQFEKTFKEVAYTVTSNRECFPLTKEELFKRNLYLAGETYLPGNRWGSKAIRDYLDDIPCNELVDVFKDIREQYKEFLDFEETGLYDFFPLWCIGTYFHAIFSSYPYVFLHGGKETGKTKTLKLTSRFAFNAEFTASLSTASAFRVVEANRSSLMIDELENINSGDNPEFRSIILSGYEAGADVLRCGEKRDGFAIERFKSYSPKMFANIAGVEDVLGSRVICVTMSRSGKREISDRDIYLLDSKFQVIREKLYRLLMEYHQEIKEIYETIENETAFSGREWQLWKPIFTMAQFFSRYSDSTVFENMMNLARAKYFEKKQVEEDATEIFLINELLDLVVNEHLEISATELFEHFKAHHTEEMLEWTQTKFGSYLRRLKCFERKFVRQGKNFYLFKKARVVDLARRYNVRGEESIDS